VRFQTERELVQRAIEQLPFGTLLSTNNGERVFMATEVRGLFGIPDLVAASVCDSGTCAPKRVAFEMKLSDWRGALVQAYRYKAFVSSVYVVIDDSRSGAALRHRDDFTRANVGLISISRNTFAVHIHPTDEAPFCDQLRARFET
jgi:hypothetical protein